MQYFYRNTKTGDKVYAGFTFDYLPRIGETILIDDALFKVSNITYDFKYETTTFDIEPVIEK